MNNEFPLENLSQAPVNNTPQSAPFEKNKDSFPTPEAQPLEAQPISSHQVSLAQEVGKTETISNTVLNPIFAQIQQIVPTLDFDKITSICKKSKLQPNELLEILKKIDQYEQRALPTDKKIYKDKTLNENVHYQRKDLTSLFNEDLPRSLIYINNEWFILMKGKGEEDNLNIAGSFNRATLGINPKNGQLVTVRSGLFIDDPTTSADSNKEIKMMGIINDIIIKREQEGDTSIPFLNSNHLIYYGRSPKKNDRGGPLIVKFYLNYIKDISDSEGGNIYEKILFVTPYCERGNLANLLTNNSLTEEERLNASKALAKAVFLLHKNSIIHADLKPANLVMNEKGEVKVIDFGLSDLEKNFEQKGQGTKGYKPIDDSLMEVDGNLGVAHDLFSFGVTLSELYFDNELKKLIFNYNKIKSKTKLDKWKNELDTCKNKLEDLIKVYESRPNKHARVIAQLIRMCVNLDPNEREKTHEGLPKIEYIMNELNKLT